MKAVWARLNGRGGASGDGMAIRTEAVEIFEGWRGGATKPRQQGMWQKGKRGLQASSAICGPLGEKLSAARLSSFYLT